MDSSLNAAVAAYVPHRGTMSLLSRVIEVTEEQAIAEIDVPLDGLFVRDGSVPAWVGVEYMAQTISAWSGGRAMREGMAPRVGFLLGCRRYQTTCSSFACGTVLRIEARQEFVSDAGLGMFDCRILRDGTVLATARVSVFEPEDGADYLKTRKT